MSPRTASHNGKGASEPIKVACAGCRYGTRVVDGVIEEPEDGDEVYKEPTVKYTEFYYCVHPIVKDPAYSSAVVCGRVECGFREEAAK